MFDGLKYIIYKTFFFFFLLSLSYLLLWNLIVFILSEGCLSDMLLTEHVRSNNM